MLSYFITHYSLLIAHYSLLIAHYSLLIIFGRIAAARRPGFSGLRYRSGPACGVAAAHPYNPLRTGIKRALRASVFMTAIVKG
jgi:hypothetical protein